MTVPDTLSTRTTWVIMEESEYTKLLDAILGQLYPRARPLSHDRDDEWSGPGVYRLQVRLNRPERRPLYSLKWESV